MKKSAIKFLAGAAIGTGLGIAATKFMKSDSGKKAKKSIKEKYAEFYNFIAPKIKKFKKMTQSEYQDFIKKAAAEFGKINEISDDEIEKLVKQTQKLWDNFLRDMD